MSRRRQEVSAVRISDEEYTRLENKLEALKNEFIACKRKLDSKCEALLILSKELDQCRSERDQFKLMAEQLRERHQSMKKQLSGQMAEPIVHSGSKQYTDKQSQNLVKLLYEARDHTKSLQFELEDTKQKLHDAQGDIKLLREQIARQRVGTTDEGMTTRHFPAHEREELVQKLESSRDQYLQLERDLQTVLDEKEELVTERDVYKTKYERLNQELNYILKGDENRVVDIDALVMENKYLQDRLKQMEEEKSMAMAAVTKYKSLLEKKKNKSCMKLGQSRGGGMVISQKQVHEVLTSKAAIVPTPQAMSDLQALAGALLDTVNDKNLALSHQRKTNKILGNRVAELEKKIKTLEVAGLWNISSNGPIHLEKLLQECNDMKTLIPERISHPSESDQLSASEEDKDSELETVTPLDSCATSPEPSPTHTAKVPDHLQMGDLDLLPTKEVTCKPAGREHVTDSITTTASYDVDGLDMQSKELVNDPDVIKCKSPHTPTNSSRICDEHDKDTANICDRVKDQKVLTETCSAEKDLNSEGGIVNFKDSLSNKQMNDSENIQNGIEVTDMEPDVQVHVYNKDKVDDEENDIDIIDRELDLELDNKEETNGGMQIDFSAGGDANSLYIKKMRNQVNGNDIRTVRENNEDDDNLSEEDPETSEKIGLLVESMAQKMCNISHKTVQRETSVSGDDDSGQLDECGSKLQQEDRDKTDENKTALEQAHNVEC